MRRKFTLEYWQDGDWYVGRILEIPGVFSQGESLDELRENIQEAYDLMVTQDRTAAPAIAQRQDVELEVGSARTSSDSSSELVACCTGTGSVTTSIAIRLMEDRPPSQDTGRLLAPCAKPSVGNSD
jgi:predicted RNase H-like HicB family nuclease